MRHAAPAPSRALTLLKVVLGVLVLLGIVGLPVYELLAQQRPRAAEIARSLGHHDGGEDLC